MLRKKHALSIKQNAARIFIQSWNLVIYMHIKKETFSAFYSPCFGTNPNIWIPESKRQNARRHMCNFMLVNPLVPRGKARWCFLPQRNLQEGLSEISRDRIMDIMLTMLTGVRVGSSTGVVTRDLLHGSFLTKAPRSLALHDQTAECGPVLLCTERKSRMPRTTSLQNCHLSGET